MKDLKLVLTSEEELKKALGRDDDASRKTPSRRNWRRFRRGGQKLPHLSFFAFTATPKAKTLEMFGVPEKSIKKGFGAFHKYTMRQAIEEGFILDVLQNYTTYKTYFELIQNVKAEDDTQVQKQARR